MNRLAGSVLCSILLFASLPNAGIAAVQWQIVWQTTGLDRPVAAIYDQANAAVYVANQNGEPWTGTQGFIAKLDPATGQVLVRHFIGDGTASSVLAAPKGMAILGDVLFVADIHDLKAFYLPSQEASGSWTVSDGHLADVVLGPGRDLFVSDAQAGEIYRLVWSNYTYALNLFYGPMATPGPLGLLGPNLLVGLGSDPNAAVTKIDIATQEAFSYVDKNPGDLTPRGLDTDDAGGIFFSSGTEIRQADRNGVSQAVLTETGAPTGVRYAKSLGLLLVANPDNGTVTAYRPVDTPPPPDTPPLRPMAAGGDHSLAVIGNQGLYGWGYNSYRQASTTTDQAVVATPERLDAAGTWRSLAGGWQHSMAIKADGSLWGWGWNWFGQIGIGTQGTAHQTVAAISRVGSDTGWTDVSGGDAHTLAIRAGALYAWGGDDFGQIGALHDPITPDNRPSPVLIDAGGANPWTQVSAGGLHSLALRTDGALYAWGDNAQGQLGLGRVSPIDYRAEPLLVDAGPWRKVCGGGSFSAGIKADGSLWAWGENTSGQLGQGTTSTFIDQPVQVGTATDWTNLACGKNHVLAIRNQGDLWGFGSNNYGQLGLGDMTNRSTPTRVGDKTTWSALSCGYLHSLAMLRDGTLYGFGDNRLSQLGRAGVTMLLTPTPLGLTLLPAPAVPFLLLVNDN